MYLSQRWILRGRTSFHLQSGRENLEPSDKYEIRIDGDRHTLRVKNCQLKDQGNYRLVCGPHIASAKLTVIGELDAI